MSNNPDFDPIAWKNKAMAFVTRSHRHLWGKNNEDPQVFLFFQGIKNQFAKEFLLGWNKFGQKRPIENWGFHTEAKTDKTLFLPSGIVIPYIVEKELNSVFILPYDENNIQKVFIVPGSSSPTLILGTRSGEKNKRVAVIGHLFNGLFLFQECQEQFCVIIHPDPDHPLDHHYTTMVQNAKTAFIFSSNKTESDQNRRVFPDVPDHCFHTYQSKEELKERCLTH